MIQTNQKNEITTFKELVKSIGTGMLFTRLNNGKLEGRPMFTVDVDDENNLWFFTDEYSEKVNDISENNDVTLSYADNGGNDYVTVNGKAYINNNRLMMERFWQPMMKIWFPKGLDDPGLAMLKVQPQEVEYWSGSGNKIVIIFKMLSAVLRGNKYNDYNHKKLNIA